MKRDIRSIRKQFRLTETEEKQILDLMREKGEDNFSDFLRKSLLLSDGQKQMEKWFNLWKKQKLEQISRDVHEILIIAKINHQVTQEHVSILLTCIQELIKEVEKTSSLSENFRNKYMR
ncbi:MULTISPECIES: SAG1252 family conjugative relaxosome accessory protein [Streptococcus]|jgi:tn5252, orf 10 protein|uniref:SAG1252 family conjugative relaxosome accessory protein n=1 Tax=Streptococcus TaxID=1301 RepID=UPI00066BCA30|nr:MULTISPECIES: SAG1252 family conjugative relaxosome accessory protein [Streptococcus]MDO6345107.1 SAG1252 family conjugative relaxosome accessory protein [Streptococcus sp. GP0011]